MDDIKKNNTKFTEALDRIVDQSVNVNEEQLQDSGKKYLMVLKIDIKQLLKTLH